MEATSTYVKRRANGRISIKSGNKVEQVMTGTIVILTFLTILAFFFFNYAGLELSKAIPETAYNLKTMFNL